MNKKTLLGREFHFGIGFLNELLDGTGLKLDELGTQDDAVLMPKLVFYSLLYSYKRSGKEVDFTIYDVHDMIDANEDDFCVSFMTAFYDSMNKDVPVDNSKKKATAKK